MGDRSNRSWQLNVWEREGKGSRIGPGLGDWWCLYSKIPKLLYLDEDGRFNFKHFEFEVPLGYPSGNLNDKFKSGAQDNYGLEQGFPTSWAIDWYPSVAS